MRAPHWPRHSETVTADDCLVTGGGKAANVAFLAQRLRAPTMLMGCVGDDTLAPLALAGLAEAGLDLGLVARAPHTATGIAMIVVRPDADKTIVLCANANRRWPHADATAVANALENAAAASVLVVDLEIPAALVEAAVVAARLRGTTVVLDPSPATQVPHSLLPHVDFITPNPREAEHLTGIAVDDSADIERWHDVSWRLVFAAARRRHDRPVRGLQPPGVARLVGVSPAPR